MKKKPKDDFKLKNIQKLIQSLSFSNSTSNLKAIVSNYNISISNNDSPTQEESNNSDYSGLYDFTSEENSSNILDNINDMSLTLVSYIKEGNLDELSKFINENLDKINLNYLNKNGYSLIGIAIYYEGLEDDTKLKIVEKLIKFGAGVNLGLNPPLHLAAAFGYDEIAKVLIRANAKIDSLDCDNKTPVMLAAEEKDEEMLKILGIDKSKIRDLLDIHSDQNTSNTSVSPFNSSSDIFDVFYEHSAAQQNSTKDPEVVTPKILSLTQEEINQLFGETSDSSDN
jgi:ankyrin repeat protein